MPPPNCKNANFDLNFAQHSQLGLGDNRGQKAKVKVSRGPELSFGATPRSSDPPKVDQNGIPSAKNAN